MRRVSRGKQKKSEAASDGEEDMSASGKVDNDETGSEVTETSNSTGKKRNPRSRGKTNEENHEDEKEETGQENGKSSNKRRKKESDNESDNEPLNKRAKGKADKDGDVSNDENKDEIEENGKTATKNKRKSKTVQKEPDNEDGEEYEVEKIVDQRTIKGRRQFLVRWKGYTEEADTWEQEKELNCDRLIEEFLAEQEENNDYFSKDEDKNEKKTKAKKPDKKSKKQKKVKGKNDVPKETKDKKRKDNEGDASDDNEEEDTKEYEVEKIIEVHFKKDKKREFLIRWKGFSSSADTWEPEEYLNCPELINKFMEKLEKIKSTDSRELRINPSHTKRYTLTMHANNKRHSRRNADKQRVTYHEYDA